MLVADQKVQTVDRSLQQRYAESERLRGVVIRARESANRATVVVDESRALAANLRNAMLAEDFDPRAALLLAIEQLETVANRIPQAFHVEELEASQVNVEQTLREFRELTDALKVENTTKASKLADLERSYEDYRDALDRQRAEAEALRRESNRTRASHEEDLRRLTREHEEQIGAMAELVSRLEGSLEENSAETTRLRGMIEERDNLLQERNALLNLQQAEIERLADESDRTLLQLEKHHYLLVAGHMRKVLIRKAWKHITGDWFSTYRPTPLFEQLETEARRLGRMDRYNELFEHWNRDTVDFFDHLRRRRNDLGHVSTLDFLFMERDPGRRNQPNFEELRAAMRTLANNFPDPQAERFPDVQDHFDRVVKTFQFFQGRFPLHHIPFND